jgi:RecJ-like exonuclease
MSKEDFSFENYSKLKETAISVAEFLKTNQKPVAVVVKAHPDNLCAAGIIVSCLMKHEAGSQVIMLSSYEDIEKRIKKTNYSTFVFIGFGIKELPNKLLKDENKNIIVIAYNFSIDKRIKIPWDDIRILSLNAFDLSENILANSGIAYLVASGFLENYFQYSGLAILGGLSRRQINQDKSLIGINKLILEEGKENKILRETQGIRIPGRESQPIHQALKYSNNPFFPGLTGNESACTSFVSKLDISMKDNEGNFRTISSLTPEETQKLGDGLVSLLQGDIQKILGPIYSLETETKRAQARNVEEFLWVLEGAIQLNKYGLALAIILGDRENLFDKLMRDLNNYHGKATTIIEEIIKNPEVTENLQHYRLMRNQEFFELESAPLVIKALVDSNIIPID